LNKKDLIGKKPLEVKNTSKRHQIKNPHFYSLLGEQTHEQILQSGKTIETEEEYLSDSGLMHKMQVIRMPVYDSDGNIIGSQGIMFDITKRKLAEEELKRSELALKRQNELFTLLLKNLPVGVFMVEAPSGKPLLANDAAIKLMGRSLNPTTNEDNISEVYNLFKINSLEPYPSNEMPIVLGMIGKSAHVDDMIVIRPDGTESNLEVFGTPVTDEQGKIWASLVNFSDITVRKQTEIALKNSQEQLQQFAAHLQNAREDEKIGLSREIHDDLGQILVALKIDMGMLKKKVFKEFENSGSKEIFEKFDNIVDLIDTTIKTTRRIMSGLRPEQLELLGFIEATKQYVQEFEERYGTKCNYDTTITELNLSSQQSVALFRILQEALSNITRHAHASEVNVRIELFESQLIMEILDNGVGFDKLNSGRSDSYGLIGMKERVFLLGGKLNIEGHLGVGSSVRVEMPYSN